MNYKTIYRGYEIRTAKLGETTTFEVWQNGEVIDQSAYTLAQAKMTIDGWLAADDGR